LEEIGFIMHWHTMTVDAVERALKTSMRGLSGVEAQRRLAQHGLNVIAGGRRRSPLRMFLDQSTDIMIILLRAAGAGRRSADIVMAVGLRWWLHQR